MSLVAGQRMVRVDDGMKGVVELVTIPGYELEELRITYVDRGEKRIAGKREPWESVKDPPRKLREEEIVAVAYTADRMLYALDSARPFDWWRKIDGNEPPHDPGLVDVIEQYLRKRG